MINSKPQVLLPVAASDLFLAGLPVSLRAALVFQDSLEAERIVFCTQSQDFVNAWSRRLKGLPWLEMRAADARALADLVKPGNPILVLAPNAIPDGRTLEYFIHQARSLGTSSLCLSSDTPVAAYCPDAAAFSSLFLRNGGGLSLTSLDAQALHNYAASQDWILIRGPKDIASAEERLFASLASEKDGYLARADRRVSIAISKKLVRWPITPNQLTTASLLVGLCGALGLACADHALQILGVAALWLSAILDGCDGEIARLKLLDSKSGRRYDLLADHIVHAATFAAVCVQVARADGKSILPLAGTLAFGVLSSMLCMWKLVLQAEPSQPGATPDIYERLASRDYVYPLVILTVFGKLKWFLWAAAAGSNVFWISLAALHLRPSRSILHEKNA